MNNANLDGSQNVYTCNVMKYTFEIHSKIQIWSVRRSPLFQMHNLYWHSLKWTCSIGFQNKILDMNSAIAKIWQPTPCSFCAVHENNLNCLTREFMSIV